jgi:thiamine biosynthesis protein ThiI
VQAVVHYHEIALKGKNRPFFVRRLVENLRLALGDQPGSRVDVLHGRLLVSADDAAGWERVSERLGTVLGVANFARAHEAPRDVAALTRLVVESLAGRTIASFRITAKRSDKRFSLTSVELERALGGAVKAATGARVDLENPALTVFVEVLNDRILYALEKLPGPGGFPVGSSGRVLALLSGGIDSPVAAYRMMKRGCRVVLAHFHAFPLQDHSTIDKAHELARRLARHQFRSRLLLVPFARVQQTIVARCPAPLRVVLYRRFMLRIAEALAGRHHARAVVTGESLGQVASQTLTNLAAIDEAARGPVLRPLVGMDKQEITAEARRIGTFEVSTLPDQDCCQLFVPRGASTAAALGELRAAERELDVAELVTGALHAVEEHAYQFPEVLSAAML